MKMAEDALKGIHLQLLRAPMTEMNIKPGGRNPMLARQSELE
jgi:hypothetical protein